jgi:hypothetical protein
MVVPTALLLRGQLGVVSVLSPPGEVACKSACSAVKKEEAVALGGSVYEHCLMEGS